MVFSFNYCNKCTLDIGLQINIIIIKDTICYNTLSITTYNNVVVMINNIVIYT